MTLTAPRVRPGRITRSARLDLPRWPLLAGLYGLPVFWATGLLPFAYILLALVMLALLSTRGRLRYIAGFGPFFAFLVWVAVCAVGVSGVGQLVGFGWRMADLVAAGVFVVYYSNAKRIAGWDVVRGLVFVWFVLIGLGLLAMAFPDVRLSTPAGVLLPQGIVGNPLVNELVNPRLAEVQEPWGAEEPYVRPAAPFPYTNSWGTAYVLLTPLVIACLVTTRRRLAKVGLVLALAVSLVPAVATSNRGMFLGVIAVMAYCAVRFLLQGRVVPVTVLLLGSGAAAVSLVLSGAVADILGRQEHSDSTGTRASVYQATLEETLRSPLVGWGGPQEVVGVDVALGTQGYVWTLMYSFGFVGLGLFLLFLWGALWRTRRVGTVAETLIHSVLVATAVLVFFYGLGSTQLLIVVLVACVLLDRSRLMSRDG